MLSTGNPNLIPQYNQNLIARFSFTNPEKSINFFAFATGGLTLDNIGSSTFIATRRYLSGRRNYSEKRFSAQQTCESWCSEECKDFLRFWIPINPVKCNVNLNTGFSWSQSLGMINEIQNMSNIQPHSGFGFKQQYFLKALIFSDHTV